LRRQIAAGESPPAGSSRSLRLDPRTLPVRFTAEDPAADGQTRLIEIDAVRVLLRRTVRGVHMRLYVPLSTYLGVAVRLLPAVEQGEDAIAIMLEHRDPALSVPLHVTGDSENVIADWQLWGNVLKKKLLVTEFDGTLREPFDTIGLLMLGVVRPRRIRRTALRARRPRMFRRRVCMQSAAEMPVHRGEREIIAPE
jgi:hypothetical protein